MNYTIRLPNRITKKIEGPIPSLHSTIVIDNDDYSVSRIIHETSTINNKYKTVDVIVYVNL